jgi:xylan 1,4-beta-xylosidase
MVIASMDEVSVPGVDAGAVETMIIDGAEATRTFPHYWERIFGSGRAVLSLRHSYRQDLSALRGATSVSHVRFHGILNDEVGVYSEGPAGEAVYNFSYVDQIYDGLLAQGVRPIVELSFMPATLAASQIRQSFWYRPVVAPPKDYARWGALITALAAHLVERYGIDEVSRWYFEVWNEPNLEFWAGEPKQPTYWMLYEHTARALKAVNVRLRVGGPATAQAAWIADFIRHCSGNGIPVDFISTHVYGDDSARDVFGSDQPVPREQMVGRAAAKAHAEIRASDLPALPLILTEFNATFLTRTEITDAPFMGAWLAETIRQCDGLVQDMSYWVFSDVFEEQGVVQRPFYGGYGLLAAGNIPKPAFNAFALLHQLGEERFTNDPPGSLVTRRSNGDVVIAIWNCTEIGAAGVSRKIRLQLRNVRAHSATLQVVDRTHANVLVPYTQMGSPPYPTRAQLAQLREAAALPAPTTMPLEAGSVDLEVGPDGLVLVTIAVHLTSCRNLSQGSARGCQPVSVLGSGLSRHRDIAHAPHCDEPDT